MSAPIFRMFSLDAKAYDADNPLPIQIMAAQDASRVRRFTASDDTIDRYQEVILPEGIDVSEYVRNPVVMAFHDYQRWPLGHAVAVGVVDGRLMIDVEFDPPEIDEEAEQVLRKIDRKTINAGSIGFTTVERVEVATASPELKARYRSAHRIHTRTKLLEYTICPIPANPNALAAALQEDILARFNSQDGESHNAPACDSATLRAVTEGLERLKRQLE